jgi:hypothetical protein
MNDRNDRSAVAADWYPDPVGRHQYRYWDGMSWTHHVADDGKASVDPLAQAPRKARSTTAVAAGHDSKPPNKSAHLQKPQGQDVRGSTLRGEAVASGVCKAFQAGRCVVQGADTGPCDWNPSNWRTCNVVIENMKHGGW